MNLEFDELQPYENLTRLLASGLQQNSGPVGAAGTIAEQMPEAGRSVYLAKLE